MTWPSPTPSSNIERPSALDVETSVEPPDDVPLEAAPADWQEQLEAVEPGPERDEFDRDTL